MQNPISVEGGKAEVRYLESGQNALVFAFNHEDHPVDADISLRLPKPIKNGTDLVTEKTVNVSSEDGVTKLHGHIAPKDVWVVELTR